MGAPAYTQSLRETYKYRVEFESRPSEILPLNKFTSILFVYVVLDLVH